MSLRVLSLNKTIWNSGLYQRVRETWYAGLPADSRVANKETIQRWFGFESQEAKEAFDKICITEFGAALESVNPQNYPIAALAREEIIKPFTQELQSFDGDEKADNALSMVLLLDQIPRNIYRTMDTLPLVYNHYDRISNALVKHWFSSNNRPDHQDHIRLNPIRRAWFYMPLLHSESRADHDEVLKYLVDALEDLKAEKEEGPWQFAKKQHESELTHRSLIERFGRYPHRNRCLGREDTKAEREYLQSGGETFGVSA